MVILTPLYRLTHKVIQDLLLPIGFADCNVSSGGGNVL